MSYKYEDVLLPPLGRIKWKGVLVEKKLVKAGKLPKNGILYGEEGKNYKVGIIETDENQKGE